MGDIQVAEGEYRLRDGQCILLDTSRPQWRRFTGPIEDNVAVSVAQVLRQAMPNPVGGVVYFRLSDPTTGRVMQGVYESGTSAAEVMFGTELQVLEHLARKGLWHNSLQDRIEHNGEDPVRLDDLRNLCEQVQRDGLYSTSGAVDVFAEYEQKYSIRNFE